MRPAMKFVDIANQFNAKITLSDGQIDADAKSILEVCMLAAPKGVKLNIKAEGPDAEKAIESLRELVEDRQFQ